MTNTANRRKGIARVPINPPRAVRLMAIDGTWCRECTMIDASESGATRDTPKPSAQLAAAPPVAGQPSVPTTELQPGDSASAADPPAPTAGQEELPAPTATSRTERRGPMPGGTARPARTGTGLTVPSVPNI
jgi:hypothetical protein